MAKRMNNGPLDAPTADDLVPAVDATTATGEPAPEQEALAAKFMFYCVHDSLPWGLRSKQIREILTSVHECNLDALLASFTKLHRDRLADMVRLNYDKPTQLAQAKIVSRILDGTSEIAGFIAKAREAKARARKAGTTTTGKTVAVSTDDAALINRMLADVS